ncbi:putative aldouronate transport system substrate-binding protein [Kribbella rubisoli]|uniref:Aldouronate transport system substrate-binding protein n=1 Tax=Kribbella rubisoli TaxID=3075929 RepID=A0A4Q7W1X7_9ACTN|nr:extracellular solute-binding protein [Kribbella rubisoli]RZU03241.1 putative aldouronate transport system substrate-binding protein [Kribbella rubisoli]
MNVSRRTLLGGSLAAAAVSLTGCSTVTRSDDIAALNKPVALPTYKRFDGPKPDLPRSHPLMPDCFYRFPADPQKVTSGVPGDGSEVAGSTLTSNPIPPTADRNKYWQELNRRLGSPLELTITAATDYVNKFATSVAGDTLGDVFNVDGSFAYLPQFLEARAQDLTEFLSGDAILEYPFLANAPQASWRGCVFSGGIRAVPIQRGVMSSNTLLARQDLLDKLGVELGSPTVDELQKVAKAVTDGKKNRWGFAVPPTAAVSAMLGLPNGWEVRDGKLVHSRELPEHKEMLAVTRQMVKDGTIHPDGVAKNNQKVWFTQGSAVMTQDTYSSIQSFYRRATDQDFNISIPVPRADDGKVGRVLLGSPNNSIAAIRPGPPERTKLLLRMLNWMAAPFGTEEYLFRKFGLPGRHYTLNGTDPVLTKDGGSEVCLGEFPIQYLSDGPYPAYFPGHPEAVDTAYGHFKAVLPTAILPPTYGLYSPTQSTKGKILDTRMDSITKDIQLGRADLNSWDEAVADYRKAGADAIRHEYEQALAIQGRK